jgi:hypothetical protein
MHTFSPTRWVWRPCLGPPREGFSPPAAEYPLELVAHRWHEESKHRYEELTRQWLELAEQRQRSA